MATQTAKKEVTDLNEALKLLDDAAQKSSHEVQEMIESDYKHLKETLSQITPEIRTALKAVGDNTAKAIKSSAESTTLYAKDTAKEADAKVRENPWLFLGGALLAGGIAGYFLAKKQS